MLYHSQTWSSHKVFALFSLCKWHLQQTIILFLINSLPLFHSEAVKYDHHTYHILLPTIEADSVHQWNLFIAFNDKCRNVPIFPRPRVTYHFRNWWTFWILKTVWLRSGWSRIKMFLCSVTVISLAEERKWFVLNDNIVTVSVAKFMEQFSEHFWTCIKVQHFTHIQPNCKQKMLVF